MNIIHCLFWFKNNRVTAVLYKNRKMEVMKFGGNNYIDFTSNFWSEWCDYSGFIKSDLADFCIVYDEKPFVSEELLDRKCPAYKSIWYKDNINRAIEIIGIREPAEIYKENGYLLFKIGSFYNIEQKDTAVMTVEYVNADNEEEEEETGEETIEITPFIKDMVKKLNEYDREST